MSEVRVKFPMSQEIWNKVVVDGIAAGEDPVPEEENSTDFVVSYDSQDTWNRALTRFEGMVEYEVLN